MHVPQQLPIAANLTLGDFIDAYMIAYHAAIPRVPTASPFGENHGRGGGRPARERNMT